VLGALESVGSNVFTFDGLLLIVGAGLTDGGKLGGKVSDGANDGEPVGMSDTSIPVVGKSVGMGDTVGSTKKVGKSDVVGCVGTVGCEDIVGASVVGGTETLGSAVSGASVSDGEVVRIGLELGKID
jgi:hypothetical protein